MRTTDPILVDTSLWVRYLRRGAEARIVDQVRRWLDSGCVATSEIVRLELLPATRTDAEYQQLAATLDALVTLTADTSTWQRAARNGFVLRQHGVIVPATDLLIATVAQHAGAELAHADRHFELMAPYLGLRTISLL